MPFESSIFKTRTAEKEQYGLEYGEDLMRLNKSSHYSSPSIDRYLKEIDETKRDLAATRILKRFQNLFMDLVKQNPHFCQALQTYDRPVSQSRVMFWCLDARIDMVSILEGLAKKSIDDYKQKYVNTNRLNHDTGSLVGGSSPVFESCLARR